MTRSCKALSPVWADASELEVSVAPVAAERQVKMPRFTQRATQEPVKDE